ncbi:MAG: hypothetical protein WDZ35_09825 [Crocinitomicaceae bacterium]
MKQFFFLCAFTVFGSNFSGAQDKIIFYDGVVKEVRILNVSEDGTIQYVLKSDTTAVKGKELIEYSYQGNWYSYNSEKKELEQYSSSKYRHHYSFFNDLPNYKYGRFSISTNLFAPFVSPDVSVDVIDLYTYNSNDFKLSNPNLFVQTNRTFTLEPEYLIFDWLSLKIPITIPLTFDEPTTFYNSNTPTEFSMSYGHFYSSFLNYRLDQDLEGFDNLTTADIEFDNSLKSGLTRPAKNLLFQVGISPKFYPLGQMKHSLYLAPSLLFGMANLFSVDYYATFDTLTYSDFSGQIIEKWRLREEYGVQKRSPFFFVRSEVLVGINFNWWKHFCFSFETGYSSYIPNKGEADNVYMRLGTEEYQHKGSFQYNPKNRISGYVVSRLHLVYRFGGKLIQ